MKALLHIDEAEKWPMVLENAKNMLRYKENYSEDLTIEVLANGPAIRGMLSENPEWKETVEVLQQQGTLFAVCRNSVNKFQIREEELLPGVVIVPAGVIEIIKKQQEGYAYIKP